MRMTQSKIINFIGQVFRCLPQGVGIGLVIWAIGATATAQDAEYQYTSIRVTENPRGGVALEWMREPGPAPLLGWHVERLQPDGGMVRLNTARVEAGLFDPPATIYRIDDPAVAAIAGDILTYRLVTIDPELNEWPSPFTTCQVEPSAPPVALKRTKTAPAQSVRTVRSVAPAAPGARMRIMIAEDGLYRLTAAQIAQMLAGFTEDQARQAIAQAQLALSCGGESVAWRGEPGGAGLFFFGQAYRDTYADRNVYFLEPGTGLAMGSANRATAAVAHDPWFWETARAEQNLFFRPHVPGSADDDYFIWAGKQLTSPEVSWQWTANVPVPDLHPAVKQGAVTAYLVSSYNGAPALDNHTILSAAGQTLDDRRWAGNVRAAQSGSATNLTGTQVPVTVELRRDSDVTTTTVLIDALEVRYARRMRAVNDRLLFQPAGATNAITVRGFSNSAIRVLDVTDPLRPVEIIPTIAQEGTQAWRVSWSGNFSASNRFLAAAAWSGPERIEGAAKPAWDGDRDGAVYLVIAPQVMAPAAAELVAHRRQQGLASLLVPLEELYDNFAFGRRDPRAIPRFLAFARANWRIPPAYVCLAGDGHLDYHDHFQQSQSRPNHVPPLLDRIYSAKSCGLRSTVGVDIPLADISGDGYPDLAIGRLPAQTPAALEHMINRIKIHEASDYWKNKILMVSDRESNNAFQQVCGRLASRVSPDMSIQYLHHTFAKSTDAMKKDFIRGFNSGVLFSIYVGHANNIGMSSPYFFTHSAAESCMPSLTNLVKTPVMLAGACMANDFSEPHPDSRCLGKGFMDTAPGGAVAVWGFATETTLSVVEPALGAMVDETFNGTDVLLGDLVRAANELQVKGVAPWMVRASVLMGDPGTKIRTAQGLAPPLPTIRITKPEPTAYSTATLQDSSSSLKDGCEVKTDRLDLEGVAAAPYPVTQVVIRNHRFSGSSQAMGTTNWNLPGLVLAAGSNRITAIAYDAAGHSATATLSVVCNVLPVLSVLPASQSVSSAAGETAFTITNAGNGTLVYAASESVSWLTVTGGARGTNGGTLVIACAANTKAAARAASVKITASGVQGSPVTVRVTQAGNPVLTVSPASANFGTIGLGTTGERIFTVKNTGGGPLAGAASVAAPFLIVSGGSYNLAPGESQAVRIRYSPATAGSDRQVVRFTGGRGATRAVRGLTKVRLTADVPGGGGRVIGTGLYTPGAKAKLKALAGPGFSFLHWEDGSQAATRSLIMPGSNLAVSATFKLSAQVPPPVIGDPGHARAMVGVPFVLPLDITSESLPTVTVTGLPAGLKYNAASKSILGTPTIPVTNKLVTIHARNTAGKVAVPVAFTLTVEPLPAWAWGSYNGWCLIAGNPDIGSAVMTVSRQGKISGKLSAGGVHYSFRASSYAAGSNAADGFSFAGNAVAGRATLPLTIVVEPAGGISSPAGLGVANNRAVGVDAVMYRNVWSDADMRASATNFNGYYTVTLPDMAAPCAASDLFGSGYLTITLNRGAVKAAGKLADGTAVSMSSTLLVDASNRIFTVLYSAPATYKGGCLFGMAEFLAPVEAGAGAVLVPMDGESFVWESRNPLATGTYGEGFVRDLDLAGGWYNKLDNLYAYYTNMPLNIGTGALAPAPELLVGANRVESGWWNPGGLPLSVVFDRRGVPAGLAAPKAAKPVKVDGAYAYEAATNTVGLTFSAVKTTGLFKGAFKAWFDYGTKHTAKSISFAGVMTPRRADPQDGIEGRGFFLWTDKSQYTNSRGRAVPYAFKWSYDFVIQSEEPVEITPAPIRMSGKSDSGGEP